MNVTPCPMKTSSSIVTPSQINVWLEILQLLADRRVLLNFDKRADLGSVADFAAIEVDEFRQLDVFAQLDVWRDALNS